MVVLTPPQEIMRGEGPGNGHIEEFIVQNRGQADHSVTFTWNISGFSSKQKVLNSKYFVVGGYSCRLLVYPKGDAQAVPGFMSVYLHISEPITKTNKAWDCFASYKLAVSNLRDEPLTKKRESWHRFSSKKKSHGWCDFAKLSDLLDPDQGYLGPQDTIQVTTDITILKESFDFAGEQPIKIGHRSLTNDTELYFGGKFEWRVENFTTFLPLLRTQKIMSKAFPSGECFLRLSVYKSTVDGVEYLSLCLESKDLERPNNESTCWCLFRLAVQSQHEGGRLVYKDSYGRFSSDGRTAGDSISLGWNNFMKVEDFLDKSKGYLVGDRAIFSVTIFTLRESEALFRSLDAVRALNNPSQSLQYSINKKDNKKGKFSGSRECDYAGRFIWKLYNFTRLKDLLKKRKITGLCIKSNVFTIAGKDCRLVVYPRGQSHPPNFLSAFLELTNPNQANEPDWSCFVSHRLSLINQYDDESMSIHRDCQNRYSKNTKDWGWKEFVSLTTLFDTEAGYVIDDAVYFAVDVLILKESSLDHNIPIPQMSDPTSKKVLPHETSSSDQKGTVTVPTELITFEWKIDNYSAFKDVISTRKIYSEYFSVGPCDVRVVLFESRGELCIMLQSNTTGPATQRVNKPSRDLIVHHQKSGKCNGESRHEDEKKLKLEDNPSANDSEKQLPMVNYLIKYTAAVLNLKKPTNPFRTVWRNGSAQTQLQVNAATAARIPAIPWNDSSGLVIKDTIVLSMEIVECLPYNNGVEQQSTKMRAEVHKATMFGDARNACDDYRNDEQCVVHSDDEDHTGALEEAVTNDDDDDDDGFIRYTTTSNDGNACAAPNVENMMNFVQNDGDGGDGDGHYVDGNNNNSNRSNTTNSTLLPSSLSQDDDNVVDFEEKLEFAFGYAGLFLNPENGNDRSKGVPGIARNVKDVQRDLEYFFYKASTPSMANMVALGLKWYMCRSPEYLTKLFVPTIVVDPPTVRGARLKFPLLNMTTVPKVDANTWDGATMRPSIVTILASIPKFTPYLMDVLLDVLVWSSVEMQTEALRITNGGKDGTLSPQQIVEIMAHSHYVYGVVAGWLNTIDVRFLTPVQVSNHPLFDAMNVAFPPAKLHIKYKRIAKYFEGSQVLQKVCSAIQLSPFALEGDVASVSPQLVEPEGHVALSCILSERLIMLFDDDNPINWLRVLPAYLHAFYQLHQAYGPSIRSALHVLITRFDELEVTDYGPDLPFLTFYLLFKLIAKAEDRCAKEKYLFEEDERMMGLMSTDIDIYKDLSRTLATKMEKYFTSNDDAWKLGVVSIICAIRKALGEHPDPLHMLTMLWPDPESDSSGEDSDTVSEEQQATINVFECVCQLLNLELPSEYHPPIESNLDGYQTDDMLKADSIIMAMDLVLATYPLSGYSILTDSHISESRNIFLSTQTKTLGTEGEVLTWTDDLLRALHYSRKVCWQRMMIPAEEPESTPNTSIIHGNNNARNKDMLVTLATSCSHMLNILIKSISTSVYVDDAGEEEYDLQLNEKYKLVDTVARHLCYNCSLASNETFQILAMSQLASYAIEEDNKVGMDVFMEVAMNDDNVNKAGSCLIAEALLTVGTSQRQKVHTSNLIIKEKDGVIGDLRVELQKVTAALKAAEKASADLEKAAKRTKALHSAELASLNSDNKMIQSNMKKLEQQMESLKADKEEIRIARAKELKEAKEWKQRVVDAESQLARLKTTYRDEQKSHSITVSDLKERLAEVEAALVDAEEEIIRIKDESNTQLEDALSRQSDASESSTTAALVQRDAEIASLRGLLAERESHLNAAMSTQRTLQEVLDGERRRMAMLTAGTGLETASRSDLQALAELHENGLHRINALLGRTSSNISGGLFGLVNDPFGGFKSNQSAAPSPYLFDPSPHRGLTDDKGQNLTVAAPAPSPLDFPDNTFDKLLGLLPSDLLHS